MPDGLSARPYILVTTDAVGGVWRYAMTLADGLATRGIGTVLAMLGPSPDATQRAEAMAIPGLRLVDTGLPLDWTASDAAELARASMRLSALATEAGVMSVHLHAPALVGKVHWRVPVVAVAHSCVATWWEAVHGGALPEDFRWRTELARDGLRAACGVIAPSAAHAAALDRVYGDVGAAVVHNGCRGMPGTGKRGRVVLTAGRLWDEGKRIAELDHAAARLDVPVRAAGPTHGPNGTHAKFHNLVLLGQLDARAMADQYAETEVFASLARYEPFGLAVLEAAKAGCALILSDIPTFRELWDGAALFVPPGADPVPRLLEAFDTPALGRAARARSGRYGAAAMVDGTLALHRRVSVPG